jgi:hypothetical protein
MHENVFARLPADKAIAFGVVEPLYCSLFHIVVLLFLFEVTLEGVGRNLRRLLAVKARAAHDRFGLTHNSMLRYTGEISKQKAGSWQVVCLQWRKGEIRRF